MSIANHCRRCQESEAGETGNQAQGRDRSEVKHVRDRRCRHEKTDSGRRHNRVRQFGLPVEIDFDHRIIIRDTGGLDLPNVNGVGVLIESNPPESGRGKDAERRSKTEQSTECQCDGNFVPDNSLEPSSRRSGRLNREVSRVDGKFHPPDCCKSRASARGKNGHAPRWPEGC